jgi:hypothetical protein
VVGELPPVVVNGVGSLVSVVVVDDLVVVGEEVVLVPEEEGVAVVLAAVLVLGFAKWNKPCTA